MAQADIVLKVRGDTRGAQDVQAAVRRIRDDVEAIRRDAARPVRLNIAVDDAALGRARAQLEALAKQAARPVQAAAAASTNVGATNASAAASNAAAAATARQAREAQRLADSEIRAARATGDHAKVLALIDRELNAASQGTVRYNNLLAQKAAAEQRAAREAEKAAKQSQNRGLGPALPRTVESFGSGAVGQIKGALGGAAAAGLAGITAAAIAGTTVEAVKLGAQIQRVTSSFNTLAAQAGTTGEALLRSLRAASSGQIDDLNLKLSANRANLLGVATSADQFSKLLQIATARSAALGTTTQEAFDDLVTGLGRASPLILDNLGITIKLGEANEAYARSIGKTVTQLTDQEKKQALINAVLAQADSLPPPPADEYAQLSTALDNAGQRASELVANLLRIPAKVTTEVVIKVTEAGGGGNAGANQQQAAEAQRAAVVKAALVQLEQTAAGIGGAVEVPTARIEQLTGQLERLARSGVPAIRATAEALASGFTETGDIEALGRALAQLDNESVIQNAARLTDVYGANAKAIAERGAALAATQNKEQAAAQAVELVRAGAIDQAGAVALLQSQYPGLADEADALISKQLQLADAADKAARALGQQRLADQKANTRTLGSIGSDKSRPGAVGNDVGDFLKFLDDQQRAQDERDRTTAEFGTTAEKTALAQRNYNDAVKEFGKDSAEAIAAERELKRVREANKGNAGGTRRTGEIKDAQDLVRLEDDLRGRLEQRRRAILDVGIAQAQDSIKRREEDQRIASARRVLADAGTSAEQKAQAQDVLALVPLERQRRELDLQAQAREAQQGVNVSFPAGAVQVMIDGKVVEARVVTNFRGAVASSAARGGL